jgi:hypothetical protein
MLAVAASLSWLVGAVLLFGHIPSRIDLLARETENLRAGECDLTRPAATHDGRSRKDVHALNAFVSQIQTSSGAWRKVRTG